MHPAILNLVGFDESINLCTSSPFCFLISSSLSLMSCYSYIDAGFFARGTYTNLGVWIRTVSNLEIYFGETDSYKIGGSFELLKSLSVNGFGSNILRCQLSLLLL